MKKDGGSYFGPPLGARKIASWAPLGALLGALRDVLGALLGRSWGRLGPSWDHIEASKAHRKRKGEEANNIGFF